MRASTSTALLFLSATFCGPCALADDKAPAKSWGDEAELSYVETSGNSEVKTLSAKNLLRVKLTDAWSGSWKLAALRGETDGALTAERYLTELRVDYAISERVYALLTTGWLKDEFAGIESNISAGPGVGYRFLTGPRHLLVSEIGALYVREQYTDGSDNERVDGRLFGSYTFAFGDKNKFVQTLEYLHDFDESEKYRINSETALVTALNSYFSIKVSYSIRHNNLPVPATLEKTDTTLAAALLVTF